MKNLKVKRYPGELVSFGMKGNKTYLDQLSDEDNKFIKYNLMKSYLKNTYDLDQSEYYSLVVFGDKNYKPKCNHPNCGNDAKFNQLSRGYNLYCSRSCQNSVKAHNQHKDKNSLLNKSLEEYRVRSKSLNSDRFKKMNEKNWSNMAYRKEMSDKSYYTINSWESKAKSKRSTFINSGDVTDECIFYIGLTYDNTIKFGITSSNLDKGRCNRKWRLGLKSIHRVLKGNRVEVSDMEMKIKFHYKSNSEYIEFKELNNLIKFIRNNK